MEFESRLANPGTYMPIFRWRLYGDPEVAPLGRSWRGAITAILRWRLSADLQMAPLRRSVTPGLRFYRSSVRKERGKGAPVLVHGQIDAGRSDFDVIFRCLYERWKPAYVLSEHWRFDSKSRNETLRHIRAGLVWANGETSLVLHRARVLARRGRRMQEFEGNSLFLFAEPPAESMTWDEYLAMHRDGDRAYPQGMIGVLHNFDGIYWEYFSSDLTELELLLQQHRENTSVQIHWVEFGIDFPTPRNVSLARA